MNESSIFFIDKTRNKYSFNNFPEALYIDTSFWIEYFGGNEGIYTRDNKIFVKDCISNSVMLVTSNRVKGEIEHTLKNAFINAKIKNKEIAPIYYRHSTNKIDFKETYNQNIACNDRLYKEMLNEINGDLNIVESNTQFISYESDQKFWEEMNKVKSATKYIISDQDAEHVVIAHQIGINSIATRDGDYFSTDNLNVFTVPSEKNKNAVYGRANIFHEFNKDKY